MSDFRGVRGFEEVWRPPAPWRVRPETGRGATPGEVRARLARIVARVPEVMVKVTGRTRAPAHLAAHLAYITRKGEIEAHDRDGHPVAGRRAVQELAEDWAALQRMDRRRRADAPLSVALVLSMPAGVDPLRLRDAASAFGRATFADRFDYLAALHTDAGHPHVHLTVRALGDGGERLNPRKADLEAWRQAFAQALRDRGVAAEATPRRARGVTRKAEKIPVRKLGERHERAGGPVARVRLSALREAAAAAFVGDTAARPWEVAIAQRQAKVRALYRAQAAILSSSAHAVDRALGRAVERFLRDMPAPDTQRLALARDLRAAHAEIARSADRPDAPTRARHR